jgi:hypothetical protein
MIFNTDMNNVGRPRHVIDRGRIDECRRSGLRWRDISNLLEVSFSTLRRWRIIHNYEVIIVTCFNAKIDYYLKSFFDSHVGRK